MRAFSLLLLSMVASLACSPGYVLRSARFQIEMLSGARPIERLRDDPTLPSEDLETLLKIEEIRRFGLGLGLEASRSYQRYNPRWDHEILAFAACDPLSFEPRTWWFPFVGRVPYLGFFREKDALRMERRMRGRGLEVDTRRAGAYSTLGWFRDPILPSMLRWDEFDLAETILHELVHATLWIPGEASFNETLANVVGQEAAMRWMISRHGASDPRVMAARTSLQDQALFVGMLKDLYKDLDATYKNPTLSDTMKLEAKAALFRSLPDRVRALPYHEPDKALAKVGARPWNNARLIQYRTYNEGNELFEHLLEQCGRDIPCLLSRIRQSSRGAHGREALLRALGGGA